MNISPIVLKGNDKGIRSIIANDASMKNILSDLENMFSRTSYCNQTNNEIKISFEGKALTMDERNLILKTLQSKGIKIQTNRKTHEHLCDSIQTIPDKNGNFYVGNLKNGQILETKDSIIIVGNIEQGAAVYSEGNIIVTGYLNGYAQAGSKGRKDAFVYSYMSGRNM